MSAVHVSVSVPCPMQLGVSCVIKYIRNIIIYRLVAGHAMLRTCTQGTDAMYNFVLKLNLATREGKALFMRKWAIGRIANGESITPREGWKFLQSLGIDVPKVFIYSPCIFVHV